MEVCDMKKIGLFAIILGTLCVADAATNLQNEPVQAQTDCRGACGWQERSCHHSCPGFGEPGGDACHQACQDAFRACTANCD
jgi:hypothetical protein